MSTNFTEAEEAIIASFVSSFQDLVSELKTAAEVRYTPAPRSYAAKGTGPDPTAESVLEPGREAVDAAIRNTARTLHAATGHLCASRATLLEALEAYSQ